MESTRTVFDDVRQAEARVLPADAYQAEFAEEFDQAPGVVWKLERAQEFHEPDVPSWRAMMAGDWERSLALIAEMREPLTGYYRTHPETRRLRVVETPLTPYLQWELHVLAVRAAAGERPRVLSAGAVREFERTAPLPEIVVVGPSLLYEVLYDEIGEHVGARRITDPDLAGHCRTVIGTLYERAEDVRSYVEREVLPLPPPAVSSRSRGTFRP
ncbi:DUF6879 family protein [Microbispora amethystogenes]|uniref:DUF6879 domain-containing protein n=1 Tax=Microbispora amethystogenes TaxID=1427754 RepID=A0ABQ4FDC5_9ACTN|nr:DUF6879 family protein [Microbispora amethystogenes]GIH32783.1 hypothetical protein Mam01_29470 [Microbispora amethystogenes]